MSHVRYGLLCWGRASRTKITKINNSIHRVKKRIQLKISNETEAVKNINSLLISSINFQK